MSAVNYITPDVKSAVVLANRVHLLSISCVSLTAKLVSPNEPKFLDYNLPKVVTAWHLAESQLRAVLPFGLNIESSEEQDGTATKLADLSVVMRLDYAFKSAPTKEEVDCIPHFVGITAYMHAWPYFRADVQYLTTKLGFPALVLPIVISGEVPERVSVMDRAMDIVAAELDVKALPTLEPHDRRKGKKTKAS